MKPEIWALLSLSFTFCYSAMPFNTAMDSDAENVQKNQKIFGLTIIVVVRLADLYGSVKEGDIIEQRFPLWHVAVVQLILRDDAVRTLQARLHALRRLRRELD